MRYNVLLENGVEDDANDAYNWYEDQQTGVGERFLSELVDCYKQLEEHPEFYSKLSTTIRQAPLKNFPFIVVYEIRKMEVIVYAVFHTSRNPKEKFKRIH